MKRNIKIGAQDVEMASNAFTPILFRQIFKKDFIREITSVRKLAGKKAEELSDEEISMASDKTELFTQLAFVMAKQAELVKADKLVALTQMDFYEWLTGYEAGDFREPAAMNAIISLWQGNSEDKHVEAKNEESREPAK